MILLIDNYDSFTYNVYQVMSSLGATVEVRRNDAVSAEDVERLEPSGIVISPGPGDPSDAGITCRLIERFAAELPILGVCLGHQCVGAVYGARVVAARQLVHGKTSIVHHNNKGVFEGLPSPFQAVRYHSLVVDEDSIPAALEITARTEDGTVMGLRHRETGVEGVQFHPESVLTVEGPKLLANFLARCGVKTSASLALV